jgi:signal peptidase I
VPGKGDTIEVRGGRVYLNGVAQEQQAQYLSVILHERMGRGSSYTLPETGDKFEHVGQQLRVNGRSSSNWSLVLLNAWEGLTHTVAQDHFLLMGDNRNNSNDSRNAIVGAAPRDMIVGQVEGVIWHDIPSTLEDANMKP